MRLRRFLEEFLVVLVDMVAIAVFVLIPVSVVAGLVLIGFYVDIWLALALSFAIVVAFIAYVAWMRSE